MSLGEKRKYTRRQTRIRAAQIAVASSDSLYRSQTRTSPMIPAENPVRESPDDRGEEAVPQGIPQSEIRTAGETPASYKTV